MNDIDQIKRIIYRNTLQRIAIGIIIIAFGGVLFFLFTADLPNQTVLLFRVVGGAIMGAGVYLFISGWNRLNVSLDRLVISLKDNPREIVWFYSYMVINMPFGVHLFRLATIFIYTVDKKKITLSVKEKELNNVMKILEKHLPHASNGYTIEKEQLYEANPALLYRD